MTCIVAYEQDGVVWMGGDSAGVDGYFITARGDQKVFKNGEYLIGFTTSFRMGQLLRYKFDPSPCPDWDLEKHMVTTFIDEVRKCFTDNGYDKKAEQGEHLGGQFLVATQGRIFQINSDFQVGWNSSPYNAVGCGAEVAHGALFALHDQYKTLDPELIVKTALEAAVAHSAGVRPPFVILNTETTDDQ